MLISYGVDCWGFASHASPSHIQSTRCRPCAYSVHSQLLPVPRAHYLHPHPRTYRAVVTRDSIIWAINVNKILVEIPEGNLSVSSMTTYQDKVRSGLGNYEIVKTRDRSIDYTVGRRLTTDFRSDWQVASRSGRISAIYLLTVFFNRSNFFIILIIYF
jgi:hypothetical protein